MSSSHLPQWRHFEGFNFQDIIYIYATGSSQYDEKSGLYGSNSMETPIAKVHCFQQKTNAAYTYSTLGTDYEGTITVVIRHNPAVCNAFGENQWLTVGGYEGDAARLIHARLNNFQYVIINVSADHSHYGSYDYLTLKRVEGVRSNGQ